MRLFRYRRTVIDTNLRNAFPNKTKKELDQIATGCYRNLCDIILETIKSFTISKAGISKRCLITNLEILDEYHAQRQSVVAVLGHYGNWEWAALSSALSVKQQMVVVYKPLSNPYFDKLINKTRSRFGVKMVPMKDVARFYFDNKKEVFVNCFVSDQSPSNPKSADWMTFLNQETAVLPGAGKLASKFNHPVIFVSLERQSRGHYILRMKKLVEQSGNMEAIEINKIHTKTLEEQIVEHPENWLWSHKRWKHSPSKTNL